MAVPAATIGRYLLFDEVASGGMASVHLGRLVGPVGFARTVAIKRLHGHLARDPEFVAMFLDEARLASRIRHANVVATLDVVAEGRELFVVMDYVLGDSLARLQREARARGETIPLPIAATILVNALHGLHAAHEAKGERGEPLNLVHRDVSPHNVLVGADGTARVIDFGVAKAVGRAQVTRDGQVKGKLSYMAPEQLRGGGIDRRADVFGASVIFWETLTGERLYDGEDEGVIYGKVLRAEVPPPSSFVPALGPEVDAVIMRGLTKNPDERYPTARAMAEAIESTLPLATPSSVGRWVDHLMAETMRERRTRLAQIERDGVGPDEPLPAPVEDPAGAGWPSPPLPGDEAMGRDAPRERLMAHLDRTDHDAAALVAAAVARQQPPRARRRLSFVSLLVVLLFVGIAAYAWRPPQSVVHRLDAPAGPQAPAAAVSSTTATNATLEAPADPATGPVVAARPASVPVVTLDTLPHAAVDVSSLPMSGPPSTGSPSTGPARHPSHEKPRSTTEAAPRPVPAQRSPVADTSPPSAPCDPPFTLDPDGTKRYKRECIRW